MTRFSSLSGRALLDHQRQHGQRGDQAVAGGAVVEQYDVSGLLAAEVEAAAHASLRRRSDRRPGARTSAMRRARAAPPPARGCSSRSRPRSSPAARPRLCRSGASIASTSSPSTTSPRSSTRERGRRRRRGRCRVGACSSTNLALRTRPAGGAHRTSRLMFSSVGLDAERDDLGAELLEHLRARRGSRRRWRSRPPCADRRASAWRGKLFFTKTL